jgi:hypothetical protein
MIDIYAAAGTFADPHQLAADAARTVMRVEQVPDIPMFRQNTAAFVHDSRPAACPTSTATAVTSGSRCSPTPARWTGTSN